MTAPVQSAPAPFEAYVETPRGLVKVSAVPGSGEVQLRHALLPFPLRFPTFIASDLALAVAEAANVAAGVAP